MLLCRYLDYDPAADLLISVYVHEGLRYRKIYRLEVLDLTRQQVAEESHFTRPEFCEVQVAAWTAGKHMPDLQRLEREARGVA